MPKQHDDDLLARLNALKPSSVNLTSKPQPAFDIEVSKPPATVEDKLADRLKSLRAGGSTSLAANAPAKQKIPTGDAADVLTTQVRDEVSSEPLADWQNDGNEQSVDDLLAELETNELAKRNPDDEDDVAALLREAREALPPLEQGGGGGEGGGRDDGGIERDQIDEKGDDGGDDGNEKSENQQDEDEADDYVQRVLAELDIERKYGATNEDEDDNNNNNNAQDEPTKEKSAQPTQSQQPNDPFALPSTPQKPPQAQAQPTPSEEDSALTSRFSALELSLPSTPTSAPLSASAKAKQKAADALAKSKAKTKAPAFTDEEMETWCCICNEDGQVRCLGCEGDIYCRECWAEGHGNGEGQERGHRAVLFVRKGGMEAAA